jgi:hypothetical protein
MTDIKIREFAVTSAEGSLVGKALRKLPFLETGKDMRRYYRVY